MSWASLSYAIFLASTAIAIALIVNFSSSRGNDASLDNVDKAVFLWFIGVIFYTVYRLNKFFRDDDKTAVDETVVDETAVDETVVAEASAEEEGSTEEEEGSTEEEEGSTEEEAIAESEDEANVDEPTEDESGAEEEGSTDPPEPIFELLSSLTNVNAPHESGYMEDVD